MSGLTESGRSAIAIRSPRRRAPFFLYYAPGATHSPHHPKKEWIAKYKGRFDQGWDKVREETLARQKALGLVLANTRLTERTVGIPAWDSLNAEQKQLYAHMMEVYAGYLSQTDYNVGRVLEAIDKVGQLDNTLVIYIVGDNGASAEGTMQGALNEVARQALLNLMSNANKFTEKGTVTIAARQGQENGRDWITLSVADTGIGMTAEQMGKLFQEFSQASSTTASKYGGTGLGLVISRRFCQMMGGDITVASELGRGSTFAIRLPSMVATPKDVAAMPILAQHTEQSAGGAA